MSEEGFRSFETPSAPGCPQCRGELIVEAVFCHTCGHRLLPDPYRPVKLAACLVVAIFALILMIGGLGVLSQGGFLTGLTLISLGVLCIKKIGDELR